MNTHFHLPIQPNQQQSQSWSCRSRGLTNGTTKFPESAGIKMKIKRDDYEGGEGGEVKVSEAKGSDMMMKI